MQKAIPCMQLRGGSSKGLYFLSCDLPTDPTLKDQVLIAAMAGTDGNDARQIDGLGGADPLTSKVGIVSLSTHPKADLDYEFVQVLVGKHAVDRTQNCGNILAGVVPFAIESGLLTASGPETRASIYMVNSESMCEVIVQCTDDGQVKYEGDTKIDGVRGTAAPVICNYLDIAGSACGSLLPTGNPIDVVDDIEVTCIDNGMPLVVIRAVDLGLSGYESRDQLNADENLKLKLEDIRLQLGEKMNLGDVTNKVVPKLCLISAAMNGGCINTRTFIPHVCHAAIGVLGAVSVASACVIPGTVADGLASLPTHGNSYSIEHPTGEFTVAMELDTGNTQPEVKKVGVIRTARLLNKGQVMIPGGIWK